MGLQHLYKQRNNRTRSPNHMAGEALQIYVKHRECGIQLSTSYCVHLKCPRIVHYVRDTVSSCKITRQAHQNAMKTQNIATKCATFPDFILG